MIVSRSGDSMIRGEVDENAIVPRPQTKTPHRTPKRRAFGDISNRKKQSATANVKAKPTPSHSMIKSTVPTIKKVSFAVPKTPGLNLLPAAQPEIEVSAGRTWRNQQPHPDDNDSILSIQDEMQAWNDEMQAFAQEERTRPLRIRQHRNAMAEKELEKRMEAVWGQDDAGMIHNLGKIDQHL
jgi:hypothetical protein